MPNKIREFRREDLDQVVGIWLEASIQSHDFMPPEFWEAKVGDLREIYIPSSETYVYDDGGRIRGFVSLCGDTLAAIFVSPADQGLGIGGKLMAKAKEIRRTLTLTVYVENQRSVAFYEACGFKIEGRRVDCHTGHAEFVMSFRS